MSPSMSSPPRPPVQPCSASPRPAPKVRLVHAFDRPYENVVATARTCYSAKGIVTEDQASARPDRRDALASSIYEAGHHTTFQHAHFQFALENVSRQFLWSFLHRTLLQLGAGLAALRRGQAGQLRRAPDGPGGARRSTSGGRARQQDAYRG